MRYIIKVIVFPINILLSILVAILNFLLGIGTVILNLISLLCIFGSIATFLQKEVIIGIEGLVIAFLLSEYGLSMLGAKLIAYLTLIQLKLKSV